jgi:hypothetical protein
LVKKEDNEQRLHQLPLVAMGPGSRPGRQLRQNGTTGKSLLFYGNHVKPKISVNQKYSCCRPTQISAHLSPSRPIKRGVGRRHDEGRVAVDAEVAIDGRG